MKNINNKFQCISSYFLSKSKKDNYNSNFRIVNKLCKYIPQYNNGICWKDIPFGNNMWDNYSCKYTYINAHQRLYVFMGSKKKEWGGHSIFEVGKFMNKTYFDYIEMKNDKEYVLHIYNEYKGKTDFLKRVFPEFFN